MEVRLRELAKGRESTRQFIASLLYITLLRLIRYLWCRSVEEEDAFASRAASLATFAEIISGTPVVGSLELITSLLETLTRVVHDESQGGGEKVFATQILMSALENVAANMTGTVSFSEIRAIVY